MPISETLGSGLRHIKAIMAGDESEDHIAALGFAAMALSHYRHEIKAGRLDPALDDMPKYEQQSGPDEPTVPWKEVKVRPDPDENKSTFYITGPMRGIEHYNFPLFDDVAKLARERGLNIISPAELDREHGIDPVNDPGSVERAQEADPNLTQTLAQRDTEVIINLHKDRGDGLIILPGWKKSTGARAEIALALWLGLRFRLYDNICIGRSSASTTKDLFEVSLGSVEQDLFHQPNEF